MLNRTLGSLSLVALTLASVAPSAVAAPKQRHAHPGEFFARAPEEVETISLPQKEAHHGGDCFRALSPVEITRGIRHWTGNC